MGAYSNIELHSNAVITWVHILILSTQQCWNNMGAYSNIELHSNAVITGAYSNIELHSNAEIKLGGYFWHGPELHSNAEIKWVVIIPTQSKVTQSVQKYLEKYCTKQIYYLSNNKIMFFLMFKLYIDLQKSDVIMVTHLSGRYDQRNRLGICSGTCWRDSHNCHHSHTEYFHTRPHLPQRTLQEIWE